MASPAKRKWGSLQQAADLLGVTPLTIRRLISTGAIAGYRLPGSPTIRVDLEALEAAMTRIPSA